MRSLGVYLVEVELATLKYNNLPPGEVLFTFRIGRNYTSLVLPSLPQNNPQPLGHLQLNVDASALEAQRCSLTLNLNSPKDKRVLGIALVNLPRDKNAVSSSYKLTQSEDKQAEVEMKIKISLIDSSSIKNPGSESLKLNSVRDGINIEPGEEKLEERKGDTAEGNNSNSSSNIRVKSKKSEEEGEKKAFKNYKVVEDKVLEVTEKEIKTYKQEKEVYYQMYQIEKAKNQVAAKFISNLIKKITQKHPDLLQLLQPAPSSNTLLLPSLENKKKASDYPKSRQADAATIAQLEQANRSLHRQVEDYKKIVDQLKEQMSASSKNNENSKNVRAYNANLAFEAVINSSRPSHREKNNNILPSSLKDTEPEHNKDIKQALAGVDLPKWLQTSIGQRQQMQARLGEIGGPPPESNEQKGSFIRKVKLGMEKAFVRLLGCKELNRHALLLHKQEMNRILEECACT